MSDLSFHIKSLVLEAERAFESPSIDAPKLRGVLIVGSTQRDLVMEEFRNSAYFKANNIPIETSDLPSQNHRDWYSVELENYFRMVRNPKMPRS